MKIFTVSTITLVFISSFLSAITINIPADYSTIQAGINGANDGDTVLVQPGTYFENIDFGGKNIVVIGEDRETTIIDGNQSGSVVTFANGEDSTAVLSRFTLTNGSGYFDDNATYGGGIFCNGARPSLFNLIIEGNSATQGGGIYLRADNANIRLENSIIRNNSAGNEGGAIHIRSALNPIFRNILVHNNTAGRGAALFCDVGTSPKLINVTIVNNVSNNWGGGITCQTNVHPVLTNSILWNNYPNEIYFVDYGFSDSNTVNISYSDIMGGLDSIVTNDQGTIFWGEGNINASPAFIDSDNDFHLSDNSPCLSSGIASIQINSDWYFAPGNDLDGNPRPNPPGSNPDMGAYENSRTTQIVVDSLVVIHGDTALVGVSLNLLNGFSYSAIDISFNGFQGLLNFIELVSDSALFGQQNWTTVINETDTLLITASAGADNITSSGTLFWLKFAVPDTLPSQFVPINILSAILNTETIATGLISGGIQVQWGPNAGFEGIPISGSYPLNVTFTDTSQAGTYPINTWVWDLGYGELDTIQNIAYTYNRPGDYTVSLMVHDEYDLSDTAIKQDYINIPIVYGDIDFNTNVQSYDASLILKHLVGYITLDSLQLFVGDVSSDTTFSALDATLILQRVVGLIDTLPYVDTSGMFLATGDLYMENIVVMPGATIDIPIQIENGANIYSFECEITYNTEFLQLDTLIFSDLLEGFFAEVYDDSGIVQMAGAGANPDGEAGIFATLRFVVSPDYDFDSTVVSLNKLRLNEGSVVEDVASMVLTIQLGVDDELAIPDKFALHQNYPNPFNPTTTLRYDLPENSFVNIIIYDMLGRQVRTLVNQNQEAGYRSVIWNATNDYGKPASAGMYLYQIRAGDFVQTKKMVLLK